MMRLLVTACVLMALPAGTAVDATSHEQYRGDGAVLESNPYLPAEVIFCGGSRSKNEVWELDKDGIPLFDMLGVPEIDPDYMSAVFEELKRSDYNGLPYSGYYYPCREESHLECLPGHRAPLLRVSQLYRGLQMKERNLVSDPVRHEDRPAGK